ncbi:MAG: heme peroxidase family protein, partial [Limnobacter sp.]|nr:heme peroxidase family protein [Limnobacter sp.]
LTDNVPAGHIFFGQFIDHDITLDDSSSLASNNIPGETENVRTPTLDLDCIYGQGPEAQPYLYNGARLITGEDVSNSDHLIRNDLPRNTRGTAIIGDPRNDENRVISQMQLGMLRFHNTVVTHLENQTNAVPAEELFEEARRLTTWHYQWAVIHDYLPTVCGTCAVQDILSNGRKVYRPEEDNHSSPYIPIEFATAAYRFGHSMIPQQMQVQPGGRKHNVFSSSLGAPFSPLTDREQIVDWEALLDSGNGQFERAAQLDSKMADALLELPFIPSSVPAFERSLAVRNLLRAQSFRIPSGEQVAHTLQLCGVEEVTTEGIEQVRIAGQKLGFEKATPLWIYLLLEGRVLGRQDEVNGKVMGKKGEGLGPVGARLVAEVLIGLMELDNRSFLGANRNWSPLDSHSKIGSTGVTNLYQILTA